MKLTYKLAMVLLLLFSGMAEVYADKYADDFKQINTKLDALAAKKASPPKTSPQGQAVPQPSTGEPIPGIDVKLPNGGGKAAPRAISDQAQGGVLTRVNTGKGTVTPGPRPSAGDPIPGVDVMLGPYHGKAATSAISDQAQGGVLTSYGKGTSGGTVTPGPRPDANSAMQDVSTTRKTSTSATINWGDGSSTTGTASKKAGKPAAPAIFDRWGNYAASNPASRTASPQKDAEHNSAQGTAAAREKYNAQSGAGSVAAPTPLMNGPNAGLVMPSTLSPAMQGPLMTPGGAMSPGGH